MTAKLYGEPRGGWTADGPNELSAVTFQATPAFLQRVAQHLIEAAAALESDESFDHVHLQDEWDGWSEEMPDVIVAKLP